MRTVIVSNIVSVDGFYAAADGNPLVRNMDEAFDEYNRERIEAADTGLWGRNSFEGSSKVLPPLFAEEAVAGRRVHCGSGAVFEEGLRSRKPWCVEVAAARAAVPQATRYRCR